ncbi:MAG TPA: tetratricopeptide repeat protein [Gemmatimonadales bacterium]|nr:tetratricopeptide repeat protein [Gemmatimonadales bacterium]
MLRYLYLAGGTYLAICIAAVLLRPQSRPAPAPTPRPAHSHGGAAGGPVRGADGASWYASIKPFCNSVEVETAQQRSPAPETPDGLGYSAACYALAGRIDQARAAIERLSSGQRPYAAGIVFDVGHPVADAGDDKSAGPIMELVLDYQPGNYMALYHAGMSEYALGQTEPATVHLKRFLELYSSPDGWRSNAIAVLNRLGGS